MMLSGQMPKVKTTRTTINAMRSKPLTSISPPSPARFPLPRRFVEAISRGFKLERDFDRSGHLQTPSTVRTIPLGRTADIVRADRQVG
jgi:hypothetical protein